MLLFILSWMCANTVRRCEGDCLVDGGGMSCPVASMAASTLLQALCAIPTVEQQVCDMLFSALMVMLGCSVLA